MRFGVPFLFGAAFWLVLGTLVAVTLCKQGDEAVTFCPVLSLEPGQTLLWGLCYGCEPWRLLPGLNFCCPCFCSLVTNYILPPGLWWLQLVSQGGCPIPRSAFGSDLGISHA